MKKLVKQSLNEDLYEYDHQVLAFDYDEFSEEAEEQLKEVLKNLGIYMYDSISDTGTYYVYILSNKPLSDKELQDIDDDEIARI